MIGLPHRCAVEVHHQPFGGIKRDTIDELDALKPRAELGADEGGARVRGVHVQPHLFIFA